MAYDREQDIQNLLAQDPELTRAQAEAQVDRNLALNQRLSAGSLNLDFLNGGLEKTIRKSGVKSLKTTGDNARIDREATEGSVIGVTVNETKGGFASLTATTKEGTTITVEPSLALLTADVPGVKITKTSNNKSEITTLTGRTTTDGFLNATITQGSPKGIEKTLTLGLGFDANTIRAAIKETSSNPSVAEKNIGVNIQEKVTIDVKKVNQKTNSITANPLGSSTNQLSGAAGNPFSNLLGNIAGIVKGVIDQGSKIASKFGYEISSGNSAVDTTTTIQINTNLLNKAADTLGVTLPKPGAVGKQQFAITDTSRQPLNIAGYGAAEKSPNFVDKNGNTNFSTTIYDDLQIPDATDAETKLTGRTKNWAGANTDVNLFNFDFVNTKEELEAELKIIERPVTLLSVACTGSALDQEITALDMHLKHVTLFNRDQYGGLQFHYLIRKDGSLQRGRPLDLTSFDGSKNWYRYSIFIAFDSGYTFNYPIPKQFRESYYITDESITAAQWRTFEMFVDAYFKAIPGGQVLSADEYAPGQGNGPGFIASEWVKDKFGKDTLYSDYYDAFGTLVKNSPKNRTNSNKGEFTPAELARSVPEKIIKPTITAVVITPTPAPAPEEVASPKTGLPPKKSLTEKINSSKEYDSLVNKIDKDTNKLKLLQDSLSKLDRNSAKAIGIATKIGVLTTALDASRTQALKIESKEINGFDKIGELENIKTKAEVKKNNAATKLSALKQDNVSLDINGKVQKYGTVSKFTTQLDLAQSNYDKALAEFIKARDDYNAAVKADEKLVTR